MTIFPGFKTWWHPHFYITELYFIVPSLWSIIFLANNYVWISKNRYNSLTPGCQVISTSRTVSAVLQIQKRFKWGIKEFRDPKPKYLHKLFPNFFYIYILTPFFFTILYDELHCTKACIRIPETALKHFFGFIPYFLLE